MRASPSRRAAREAARNHERRNDRVQRPLARGEHVRMAAIEREQRAAILQRKPGALGDDARSEAREVALDERHHVAVAIDDGRDTSCRRLRWRDCAASFGEPGPTRASRSAGSMSAARSRAYSLLNIAATGTSENAGSATWRCMSAYASFFASIRMCSASAELWPVPRRRPANASMMFSIISAAMPAPFGGSSKTSQPR